MPQGLRVVTVPAGLVLAVALGGLPAAAAPAAPVTATGVPETLAQSVAASDKVVDPPFSIDFVAVTWSGDHGQASVRFRAGNAWTAWQPMGEDGIEESGEFASGLVPGGDADAYQVRIPAGVSGARSVAMNTTDGPATAASRAPAALGAAAAVDGVVSRAGWGADESMRTWDPDGFHPVQKLTVHHTASRNDDPDPAATVRAIYRLHTIDRGFGDIGYQMLIDAAGTVYEGRYTDTDPATPAGFDADGDVVTGAHVTGYNSGNVGISLLGTYEDRRPTALAQRSLERMLATVATRAGISATGSSTYVNPADVTKTWTGPNILGHRDLGATACPGGITYALLPTLRQRVAQRMAGTLVADSTMVRPRQIVVTTATGRARVTWRTAGDPSDTQLRYWPRGNPAAAKLTPLDIRFVEAHNVLVTGLARGTYDYQMIDADKAGNRYVSGANTFRVP